MLNNNSHKASINSEVFPICLRTSNLEDSSSLQTYLSIGGYEQIQRIQTHELEYRQQNQHLYHDDIYQYRRDIFI